MECNNPNDLKDFAAMVFLGVFILGFIVACTPLQEPENDD